MDKFPQIDWRSVFFPSVSVTEIFLRGTWDYFLDWLGYRFPGVRRLIRPAPLLLIKDGRMLRRNMRQEMITEEELMEQLREHGIERVEEVKKSYMEGDGRISVITTSSKRDSKGAEEGGPERSKP